MQAGLSIEKELVKGVVDLARHKEFYGHVVQQFERVFVKGEHQIQTAAVGRYKGERFIKLYLNTDFFGEMYKESKEKGWLHLLGVLEHEILHCVLNHLFVHFEDKQRGNVAKDLVVNSYVAKDRLPGDYVHPEKYGFEEGKSTMWYYTHLRDNDKYKKQCKEGNFGLGGALSHIMSSHKMWEDAEGDLVAKEFMKDIVRKAKDLCNKSYGDVPGEVIAEIDELLKREKSIVPWGKVLRMFVASCAESILDYTIKRVSKRYGSRPGTRKGDVLNIAVAVDTSGCFVGETLIPMADGGFRRIDDVKKGDLVVSSAFGKGQVIRECLGTFEKEAYELVRVEADKGYLFDCTPCHRVFVVEPSFDVAKMKKYDKGRRGRFYQMLRSSPVVEKRADELKEGDWVVVANNTRNLIPSIMPLPKMTECQSGMYVTKADVEEADRLKLLGVSYREQGRLGLIRFGYQAICVAKRRGVGLEFG